MSLQWASHDSGSRLLIPKGFIILSKSCVAIIVRFCHITGLTGSNNSIL